MPIISFFNNKGGVGKTTLCGNVCAHLALTDNKKILVVDCDPQCNLTQFILREQKTERIYLTDAGATFYDKTIMDVVRPIFDGDASVDKGVRPLLKLSNRFGVDILPGHPSLSLLEDKLSQAWGEMAMGEPRGFRISNWLSSYLGHIGKNYDYIFIDVGPSLGALNRSVLLACHNFIAPLTVDAFSVLGLRNIKQWMERWIDDYDIGLAQANRRNSSIFKFYDIRASVEIRRGFLGYTLQQYQAKSQSGRKVPVKAFERISSRFPDEISSSIANFAPKSLRANLHLGDVQNMFSILPLAQASNAPVEALTSRDGLTGGQVAQAKEYKAIIAELATAISSRASRGCSEIDEQKLTA